MKNTIRFIFAAYCLAAFILALLFSGFFPATDIKIFLLVISLVFYITASVGLLNAHRLEKRPLIDLLLFAAYPFPAYFLVFLSPDYAGRTFWTFAGFLYFLVLTGGFVLGVFLSPVIAGHGKYSWKSVSKIAEAGIEFIKARGLAVFALVVFSGIVVALGLIAVHLFISLPNLTVFSGILLVLLLLFPIVLVMRFTYRHTTFNLLKDPELRRTYERDYSTEED